MDPIRGFVNTHCLCLVMEIESLYSFSPTIGKNYFHCTHLSKKFQIFTAIHKSNVFRSEAKIRLTKLSPNAYLPAKRDCMRNIVLSKLYEFLRAFSAFHFVRIYGNNAELYSRPLHDLPSANNWASKSLFFDSFIRLCVRK